MLALYLLTAAVATIVTASALVLAWARWQDSQPRHRARGRHTLPPAICSPKPICPSREVDLYADAIACAEIRTRLDFHHHDALDALANGRHPADVLDDVLYAIRHLLAAFDTPADRKP